MVDQLRAADIHRSVLLEETMSYLAPSSGGLYVDGTMGMGGHSEAILKRSTPDGRLIALEWDEAAIALSQDRLRSYADRLTIVRENFANLPTVLNALGIRQIDGLLIDIGLSSLQLDCGGRGFSFQRDEFLDMRMDQRQEKSAADLLAHAREEELADIFYYYGDEEQSRPIAREIVQARMQTPVTTSGQLADIVARAIPKRFHPKKIHVATKVFQALRVAVNRELENLSLILDAAVPFLRPGARFCVISFHSLEDRMVKRKFREHSELKVLTSKPVMAGADELEQNPRSRSAKLRVAVRKGEPGQREEV
ncbi:MAG: 16S rRNA (cytosine(1402)-N(4))-methyltransferase RsmH [Desulfobulbaceae bacterium]|uniref:Ribosomal RNA small subunit methyltransferase H n=1 Tax=Candidatus Desulfatifera sulfidica TaxID=2841691 RepID=A0A8J6N7M4_9BACT|nr:16S rRNA (cytosine(1402)-N(4))-methyltransferase RsmH [Candidatus Desulfatifera sulfidica]